MFAKWERGEVETNTPGLHHWSLDCCKLSKMLEHFCSSKVDAFFKGATAIFAITLVSFLWPFSCPLW
jgi:hypothetical protein